MKKALPPFVLGLLLALSGPAFGKGVTVLTSIFPLREFASVILGDRGTAAQLLPPGAGVHTWQPRPSDILRLASADLFLSVGAGLEPWLSEITTTLPEGRLRSVEVSRGLPLLPADADHVQGPGEEHGHGPEDPHFWLDFGLDEAVVDRIVLALSEIDPGGAVEFRRNAEPLKDRLRRLDSRFAEALKPCAGRAFVVAGHSAFAYLARRYHLVQKPLLGVSPDAQPRPRQMMEIVDFCRREGVRAVFFETSVPPDLARTLAAEIGGRVLVLFPGHNLTRDQMMKGVGFFDMMEDNLKSLREGLGCR